MRVTVASCQTPADVDNPGPAAVETAVREAARAGARLVVLPEQAVCGFNFTGPGEAHARAEDPDGATVQLFRSLSAELGCVIVGGYVERGTGDHLHNSAVVVDRGDVVDNYRKVHLWGREVEWFTPGDQPPRAVETSAGMVATVICYDLEIPEWSRLAALSGAEVIAAPCNWPLLERPAGERPLEVIKAQAVAGANKIPVVVADRCGTERGQEWIGGSCIVDSTGYLLAGPATPHGVVAGPSVLVADLDLDAADKRLGPHNDAFADRRPHLYGALARRQA